MPAAWGTSQARGQTGATAVSLHHSHSNTGSTPQLMATPDPIPIDRGQGPNLCPHGC